MKIFLDTGIFGQLVHVNEAMKENVVDWAITMLERGEELIVPEIADLERWNISDPIFYREVKVQIQPLP
jgi:hypothetical protein